MIALKRAGDTFLIKDLLCSQACKVRTEVTSRGHISVDPIKLFI